MSPGAVRPTLRPSADKYSPHQFRTFPFHTCLEICCRVVGISRKLFGQVGRDSIRVMSRVVETPEASRPPVPQLRPPAPPCPEELLLLLPPTSLSTAPSCSHYKGPQAEGRAKVRGVQRGGASRQGPRQWFRQRI